MNNKDKAIAKIKRVINELELVLVTKDMDVLSVSSSEQIYKFLEVFEATLNKIVTDNIPPKSNRILGIAKVVIEQWPFELALGGLIIEAEQAYREI
jgi:single-stranded DNA-specific DHH superfamily exonuclease